MKWINNAMLLAIGMSVFVLATGVRAQGGGDKHSISGAAASIIEQDIEYSPEEQIVHVGQVIRVENKDPFEHKSRVTLQKEDGGLGHIALNDHVDKPGTSFTFTLDKAGSYEIRCLLHDGMTATIKAVE